MSYFITRLISSQQKFLQLLTNISRFVISSSTIP